MEEDITEPENTERELRFGDPESLHRDRLEKEAERKQTATQTSPPPTQIETPKVPPSMAPRVIENSAMKKAANSTKVDPNISNPRERIEKILRTLEPGKPYPEELADLVEMGRDAVPFLSESFLDGSAHWEVRWVCAMALGGIGGEAARKALEMGAQDPLFLIRMASVHALSAMGDPRAAYAIRPLLKDPAMFVRTAAVDALGEMEDRDSVASLVDQLEDKRNFHRGRSLWVRKHIVEALARIGTTQAEESIFRILHEDEDEIRKTACESLLKMYPDARLDAGKGDCGNQWIAWRENRSSGSASPAIAPESPMSDRETSTPSDIPQE